MLLGLPCLKCRCYYDGKLTTCPVCQSTERQTAVLNVKFAKVNKTLDSRDGFLQAYKAHFERVFNFIYGNA